MPVERKALVAFQGMVLAWYEMIESMPQLLLRVDHIHGNAAFDTHRSILIFLFLFLAIVNGDLILIAVVKYPNLSVFVFYDILNGDLRQPWRNVARRAAVQIRVAENDSETYTDSTTTS